MSLSAHLTAVASTADPAERARMRTEIDALWCSLVDQAQRAWPEFTLAQDTFAEYVAGRLQFGREPSVGAMVRELQALHLADLYLACGCSSGNSNAIAVLERRFIAEVSRYLSRADSLVGFDDEVKQRLRERLLVSHDGLLPKITLYNGRGPLGGWLRMTATRLAVDLRRAQRRRNEVSEGATVRNAALDPELQYLKARYRHDFERALEATFAALEPRQGNIIRLYFLEGLNSRAIAAMYGVSRRTVQRWILDTQANILSETRRRLSERLALSNSQLDSLMGLVQSQLSVSLQAFFQSSSR